MTPNFFQRLSSAGKDLAGISRLAALAILLGLALTGCSKTPAQKEAAFLAKGKKLFQEKDYARAVLEFQNATKALPQAMAQDAEPYYQLGLAHLQLNDVSMAVRAFRKAVEIDPKHAGAQLKLAELMAASSNKAAVEDAVKRLDVILGEKPEDAEVLHTLAVAEARLGKVDDAVQHLQQALSKAPADLRSSISLAQIKMAQGDLPAAEQIMKTAVQQAPQSVDAALAMAEFYLRSKRQDEGYAEVQRALQLDPNNESGLQVLGSIQSSQGHPDQAEQTYKRLSQHADKRQIYALFLFQEGKRDEAIAEMERLVKADPADKDMRSRLVAAYLDTNRTQQAESLLTAALKKDPKDSQAMIQRTEMYLRAGKIAEAERDANQLADSHPRNANAHYVLSKVLLAKGSREAQRRELNETLRLDPTLLQARVELSQALISEGDAAGAVDVMNQTPDAQKNTPPAIVGRNWAFLAKGDQAAARAGIDQGLKLQHAPVLLYQDAVLKATQKDYSGARTSLDQVLEANPENIEGWTLLGKVYTAQNQMPAAVQKLRQAAAQHSKSAGLQYLLAQWLMAAGNRSEARSALLAATSADPTMVDANVALAQMDFSDGNHDEARKILAGVVASHPKNTAARMLLAGVEEKAGNTAAAIAQYRAVVEADPKQVTALNNLAFGLMKDNPDEALTFAQQAAQLLPNNAAIQDTMGWAYYHKGLYGPAVQQLEKAVAKDGTPLRKYHLAMAYLKVGDEKHGQDILKAALKADPGLAKDTDH